MLEVLQKGPNEFRVRRLEAQLMATYEKLTFEKDEQKLLPTADLGKCETNSLDKNSSGSSPAGNANANTEELYSACKKEADLLYKKVMNDRAVLFALANEDDFLNPNLPDKVARREKLAIEVVTGWQKVSQMYDRAAYVKENGRLPNTEENITEEYNSIPDVLVKKQLDLARKAFNKLKNKEATPQRVVLMQKHKSNIEKLEAKWHSLQAVNK